MRKYARKTPKTRKKGTNVQSKRKRPLAVGCERLPKKPIMIMKKKVILISILIMIMSFA